MCGIVGVYSNKNAQEKTMAGLLSLSYRGYDSAGIASVYNGRIVRLRTVGKLDVLEKKYNENKFFGDICIGHTRWATHGKPAERNAHPIVVGNVAVVHNGIIENYAELKAELENNGVVFEGETDTEVVAALTNQYIEKGCSPLEAVQATLKRLIGSFAFGFIFNQHDNLIIAAKRNCPLAIGYGPDSVALCSDINGLSGICDYIAYLDDNDIVIIDNGEIKFIDHTNTEINKKFEKLSISSADLEKGDYDTFMLKEINEQPAVIAKTLLNNSNIDFNADNLNIIACGTSYHAGMIGKYWLERYRNIKVNVEVASEFAYRYPCLRKDDKFMVISQSGETSDIISVLKNIRDKFEIYSIVNTKNSAIPQLVNTNYYTEAGIEVGVASTKAFMAQLTVLAKLSFANNPKILDCLNNIPMIISETLNCFNSVSNISAELKEYKSILFIGRDLMYPLALEGALKLKELSYIHAEAFAAGELKHGPIALVDSSMAIIVLAPMGALFEKTRSNIQELLARDGQVYAITNAAGADKMPAGVKCIVVPDVDEALTPFVYTIPLQFLAYAISKALGRDIDRPRNLAKAITVE